MSYSLTVKASNKDEAKQEVAKQFDAMTESQPVHKRDRAAVLANVDAVLGVLADDDSRDVAVSVNGYLSWQTFEGAREDEAFSAVSVSAQASLMHRAS